MNKIVPLLRKGTALEMLYKAAERVKESPELKVIVVLRDEDIVEPELYVSDDWSYEETAYSLFRIFLWQHDVGLEEDED
jgi:hypothetical protein